MKPSRLAPLIALCAVLLVSVVTRPALAQTRPLSNAELTKRRLAEEAAGSKNLARAHLTEAQRKKAFTEFLYANRCAHKALGEALASGKQKHGQSGQWAHDIYFKPLFRKWRINEDGWDALEKEGIEKDWPLPSRMP